MVVMIDVRMYVCVYYCNIIIFVIFLLLYNILGMLSEGLSEPVLIQDLHQSHPDLNWRYPIQAVDGGVLAVYEDSDNSDEWYNMRSIYNVIKIDQEGKITNKLYVTEEFKYIRGLIWEEPDLYVILDGDDIVHVREGVEIKQHQINNVKGWLHGGAVDKDDILIVDNGGGLPNNGRVISYNVQTGHEDIKLQGLQYPTSITKTVYNNQVLYLITERGDDHRVSVYNSSWIKQKTLGSG